MVLWHVLSIVSCASLGRSQLTRTGRPVGRRGMRRVVEPASNQPFDAYLDSYTMCYIIYSDTNIDASYDSYVRNQDLLFQANRWSRVVISLHRPSLGLTSLRSKGFPKPPSAQRKPNAPTVDAVGWHRWVPPTDPPNTSGTPKGR